MLVTIPVTGVSGFPSFITSTVCDNNGAPVVFSIKSITDDAVCGFLGLLWHMAITGNNMIINAVANILSDFII
ncbi:MAG: hypothetical protein A2X03_19370 [Bacteroidetes bacterium GWA2_40_15]|nr:MAG: hypothetical protein A2X03_19370 [Bacteroidetes bacterium GWA2_40_15]